MTTPVPLPRDGGRLLLLLLGGMLMTLLLAFPQPLMAQENEGDNENPYSNDATKQADTEADELSWKFPAFILGGVALGFFVVLYVLPRFSEKVGSMLYDSGEMAEPDARSEARAKLAQGDYDGAIEEFEKIRKEVPDDRMPVVEICKIYDDNLGEPGKGLEYMETALQSQEWPEEDAAFFMFRIADLHIELNEDQEAAKTILEQIGEQFPGTRHSANANHKLSKLGLA